MSEIEICSKCKIIMSDIKLIRQCTMCECIFCKKCDFEIYYKKLKREQIKR